MYHYAKISTYSFVLVFMYTTKKVIKFWFEVCVVKSNIRLWFVDTQVPYTFIVIYIRKILAQKTWTEL